MRRRFALFAVITLLSLPVWAADPPKRDWPPLELVGKASAYWYKREWRSYYWREDFAFQLEEEKTGTKWKIISREPTPAYGWRMGTTFTGLKVDWPARPRVKVIGVKAVDRLPPEFYDFKLNEPNLATALIVFAETKPDEWKEFYVNNWFHPWGDKADKVIHGHYADKPPPYNIFGFARGQSAPFDKAAQAIIDKNKDNPSLMFQGRVKTAKDNPFGYEIALIDLIGRDVKSGGPALLHGDAKSIPLLDTKKPDK